MSDSSRARPRRFSPGLLVAGMGAFTALLAGCAQDPGPSGQRGRSSEYFPSSKYGAASERVVADGQAVPRGGGQRLVGRPYTVAGKRYVPREVTPGYTVTGNASWYGSAFHGRRTANGEVYDMRALSAAHPTMPLPSYARVTNLKNGYSVIVRVNDRGPFHSGRVLDVSQKVADTLDFRRTGTGRVKVDYVGAAGLAGSDDNILLATLRTDGRPANLDGPTSAPTTMIAQASPPQSGRPSAGPETAPQTVASIAAAPPETTIVASSPTPPARTAFAATPASSSAQMAAASGSLMASVSFPAYAPLPPPRPLGLGSSRGRSLQPAFFAEPSPVASMLIRRGPFEGVSLDGLQPLR